MNMILHREDKVKQEEEKNEVLRQTIKRIEQKKFKKKDTIKKERDKAGDNRKKLKEKRQGGEREGLRVLFIHNMAEGLEPESLIREGHKRDRYRGKIITYYIDNLSKQFQIV